MIKTNLYKKVASATKLLVILNDPNNKNNLLGEYNEYRL